MRIQCDSELQLILEFMQANVEASKLVSAAKAVGEIAPLLWSGYQATEQIRPLELISEVCHGQRSAATVCRPVQERADDDFVAAEDS